MTPAEPHLLSCHHCELVQKHGNGRCTFCGHELVQRQHRRDLQQCWSLWVTALIFYVPANLLPIMQTSQLGHNTNSTIAGGVVLLWEHGSWLIAAIIFIASLLVPLAKFVAIAGLCLSQHHSGMLAPATKLTIFRLTEFVGRWSMVDVFVVGFLAALIQMGQLMNIHPGPAALAFGAMVIFTMLAAKSIDPRIFWTEGATPHE